MSGLVALVPLAELLAELGGDRRGGLTLAVGLLEGGLRTLPQSASDVAMAANVELEQHGVVRADGSVDLVRAAELVITCGVLAAATPSAPEAAEDPRLVFSAPEGLVPIMANERLDGLVLDIIRRATSSLIVGGAFWNDAGFEILNEVLLPAIQVRRIPTTIYANLPEPPFDTMLRNQLDDLTNAGPVTVRWFSGPQPTMLHAKFVIRDATHGYLGTANLTSWGMKQHIEAGVELTAGQSARFIRFLEELETAHLFSDRPM